MNYININKKKLVGRNNQICSSPIVLDYSTVEEISFQFINDQNQIQSIEGLTGLYFAGSLGIGQQSYDLLFLSKDFSIENDVLTFNVDTYTRNYLDKIKKKNTEINIEIGQISVETKKVMLRDYASAYPRVYVAGLSPQEIDSHDYYTKEEVDELIAGIELSGYATEEYVNNTVATKQDIIDADNKLSYALVSGAPTIPTKTSDLTNDSGFITDSALQGYATETYVNSSVSGKADKSEIPTKTSDLQNDSGFITENALSGKQDKITAESKLAYSLISGTPTIPTKTSDLTNDSDFQNASQVQTAISGKQDKITSASKLDYALLSGTPTIPTKTSDLQNDSGFITENALSGKQDKITAENKLAYSLISGTPTIPTKTSDLTNDSDFITNAALQGYATEAYVDGEVSGKQDKITSASKLDYALLSGTPTIPDSVNVSLEMKTTISAGVFNASFTGKQIQKYVYTDATSGTIEITYDEFTSTANDIAPTIELHVATNGDISTITLPANMNVIDIPATLTYNGQTAADITYHCFTLRAEKDMNGTWQYYINYAYAYTETEEQ